MYVFKVPIGVVEDIKKLMSSYIWGRYDGGRMISWISWDQVCNSVESGGLGLGSLRRKNEALLIQWAWKFGTEKHALWRRIMCAKYGGMKDAWSFNC